MQFPAVDARIARKTGIRHIGGRTHRKRIDYAATLALTAQRYRIRRRIFDTLLKRRIYHRFGASQFSGMILICFLGKFTAEIERG